MLIRPALWLAACLSAAGCQPTQSASPAPALPASQEPPVALQDVVAVDESFDEAFVGQWEIRHYGVAYEIRRVGDGIVVSGHDTSDGEEFEVSDVKWEPPYLMATFRMPSTNHVTKSRLSVQNERTILDEYTGSGKGAAQWNRKRKAN